MHPWSHDPIWERGPAGAGCQALRGTEKQEEMGGGDGVLQRERGDALPVDLTSQTGLMIDPAESVSKWSRPNRHAHPLFQEVGKTFKLAVTPRWVVRCRSLPRFSVRREITGLIVPRDLDSVMHQGPIRQSASEPRNHVRSCFLTQGNAPVVGPNTQIETRQIFF
ncbi:hypothetical protein JB92DRAFT_2824304 [Gautieria morchelliformis]|nr:hypothetical protein JB92DRAFT_2824304 [Gautieria morchelliformis]